MSAHEWTRVEGMIIGRHPDPEGIAAELGERGILAQLEWVEASPHLIGLTLAAHGERLAVVSEGDQAPDLGPTCDELASDLAILYEAEVRIGSTVADHLPEKEDLGLHDELRDDEEEQVTSRLVEIGATPASSVPLLAALEGVDLADVNLSEGKRAILAELPPNKVGWNFGDLPLVSLSCTSGRLQAFLVTDDHIENVVTHDWNMKNMLVAGGVSPETLPQDVTDLVGDGPELERIAAAVPGADAKALRATQTMRGAQAVTGVVAALGLPEAVALFLLGQVALDEITGAHIHRAKGISNAIGRSVDIMLTDRDRAVHPVFDAYQALSIDRPWIVRSAAAVEAAVGAGLMVLSLRSPRPRRWWTYVGGAVGTLMVVDSVAEIFLAKYVQRKDQQRLIGAVDL